MDNLAIELENLNVQQIKTSKLSDTQELQLRGKENYLRLPPLALQECFLKEMTNNEQATGSAATYLDATENIEQQDSSSSASSASVEDNSFDASEEESEVDVLDAKNSKRYNSRGGVNARKMPQRSVKADPLRFKLRTSMKPPKTSPKTTEKLRPSEIKKLYTNKKLTNFRPTSLETIFEEPQPMRGSGDADQFRLVGAKKLRRSLICSDGLNANKTVVNRRRARIKSKLGRRFTWKKMPLQNFMNHIQSANINSESEEDGNPSIVRDELETKKTFLAELETINEGDDFEMDVPDEKAAAQSA